MVFFAFTTWLERKLLGRMQLRFGPNRAGPKGLLVPIADLLKLIRKEAFAPSAAKEPLYILAPVVSMFTALLAFSVLPVGRGLDRSTATTSSGTVANLPISLILIFALGSIGIYGFIVGGWASESKYSILGSMRTCAQLVSYEVSLALSVLGVVLMGQSLNLTEIVDKQQATLWFFIPQFVGLVVFLIGGTAETSRAPFDLPEADTELVAGYHTEYSGMRWGLFQAAEYINLLTLSGLCVTLFFDGYHFPWVHSLDQFGPIWFVLKLFTLVAVFIWLRATQPRLRYDQLMRFGWKVLLPVATVNARRHGVPGGARSSDGFVVPNTLKGFGVTLKQIFKKPITQQYPEYKRPVYPRYRGRHRLHRTRTGSRSASAARSARPRARPTASASSPAENTADNRVSAGERYARIYEINMSRCIFCGYCELACPFDAITLGNDFEISEYNRDDLIYTKDMLLAPPIKRVPVADRDLYDTPIPYYKDHSLDGELPRLGRLVRRRVRLPRERARRRQLPQPVLLGALADREPRRRSPCSSCCSRGEFVAAGQVLVYGGAVMVMFLFVIAYLGDRSERVAVVGRAVVAGRRRRARRRRDPRRGDRRRRAEGRRAPVEAAARRPRSFGSPEAIGRALPDRPPARVRGHLDRAARRRRRRRRARLARAPDGERCTGLTSSGTSS